MNEAGLYVGEMTLLGTVYPPGGNQPKIYHHQWIQYLLDNFETVEQVLADLGKVGIEGHCQWHFFITDENGQTAIIEFIKGKTIIHTGESMPVKILCNTVYDHELATLREYEGFGGHNQVDFGDKNGPLRFVQVATMLQQCPQKLTPDSALDHAFTILQQLDCGNNKWKIVFNIHERRMYYRTWLAEGIRSVNLTSFDLSGCLPAWMLDINQGDDGNTSGSFIPYSESLNLHLIEQMWKGINMGFVLNAFFKPLIVRRLSNYPKTFEAR